MDLKYLNAKYALVNIGYMLLVSGSLGFAYNYLSQSGFEVGTIGTVMSLINLMGVFLGPIAADIVDRSDKITQKMFIMASMVVCAVLSALLLIIPAGSFLILPVIVLAFMSTTIGMPLLNGMAFIYEKSGGIINYGLCRGLGSAAYAVGSALVGNIWAMIGRNTLPLWVIAGAALTFVCTFIMPNAPRVRTVGRSAKQRSLTMGQFFGKYQDIMLMVLALVLMYFCHFLIQNYLAKIIGAFTSDNIEGIQGTALFIQAMVELPAMFGFAFIMKKFSIDRIIVIASIFYSIKHILIMLTGNVPMLYASMVLQMLSFALLTPATVYFSNKYVAEADRNKGQAVFATASSVGGLLASFIGGWLFQLLNVRVVLAVGVISSVCGTLLIIVAIRKVMARGAA